MIRIVLLASILLLVSPANGFSLIDPSDPRCQEPSFACQDFWMASSCKTVKSCITNVWEKMDVPKDKNEICDICKQMVQEARDQLESNETQEELKEVLEGSCDLIPVKFVSKLCRKIADDFIPDLIDILASRMDPDTVCTIAGLCNLDYVRLYPYTPVAAFQSRVLMPDVDPAETSPAPTTVHPMLSQRCSTCKRVMENAKQVVNFVPEENLAEALVRVCAVHLGESAAECQSIMNVYLPAVYNFLKQADTDAVCIYMKNCPSNGHEVQIKPFLQADNETCEFCENLVQHLRDILSANSTEEEIKDALLNMCTDFGPFAEECKDYINDYFDMLYAFILEELQPESLCALIGLCDSTTHGTGLTQQHVSLSRIPLVRLFPSIAASRRKSQVPTEAEEVPLQKLTQSEHPDTIPLVKLQPGLQHSVPLQKLAQAIKLQKLIPSKQLEETIPLQKLTAAKQLEETIPLQKLTAAKQLEETIPLQKIFPAKQLQSTIQMQKLTPAKKLTQVVPLVKLHPALPKKYQGKNVVKDLLNKPGDSVECEVCKMLMNYVKKELQDNATEQEIKNLLREGCQLLPQEYVAKCDALLDEYLDLIVNIIIQEDDPDKVCQLLNLCPGTPAKPKDDESCEMCKMVVNFLETELKDNRTEESIKKALEKVCLVLPQQYAQQCQNMIEVYTDLLIALLLQEVNPDEICELISLCPKSATNNVECAFCEYALHFVQTELMSNKTEEGIKSALERVCHSLPSNLGSECEAFVEEYGASLVVLIAQELDPSIICVAVRACPKTRADRKSSRPTFQLNLNMSECDTCSMVVSYLEKLLQDNDVDEEVTKLVERVCSYIPKTAVQQCRLIVNTYGPYFLHVLGNLGDSKQVCQEVDLCPKSAGKVHLLGAKKCTYGPSYWCQSPAHATACNAHEYCRTKVWKK